MVQTYERILAKLREGTSLYPDDIETMTSVFPDAKEQIYLAQAEWSLRQENEYAHALRHLLELKEMGSAKKTVQLITRIIDDYLKENQREKASKLYFMAADLKILTNEDRHSLLAKLA